MANFNRSDIRPLRLEANLSQAELAEKIGVSQALVSQWENEKAHPGPEDIEKLGKLFAEHTPNTNTFGRWVRQAREHANLTVAELAAKARVSSVGVYKIESGEIANPKQSTREKIADALGQRVPDNVAEEAAELAAVQGVGEMVDFEPHAPPEWPKGGGIYVLYDVSERPIYVGQGGNVETRLKDHSTRFWYRDPIVRSGSFIKIDDKNLRTQVERLLIRFLKKNAIINKQHVDDDER